MISNALEPLPPLEYSNFDEFRSFLLCQNFSLPESLIFYIAKNIAPGKLYQKLIQTCKYFFLKNPIVSFHCLHFAENEWKTCINQSCLGLRESRKYSNLNLNIKNLQSRISVVFDLKIISTDENFVTSLIPKFCHGEIESLRLYQQKISFNNFLLLSNNIFRCHLVHCFVIDENGKEIPIEEIISNLSKIEIVEITLSKNSNLDLSKTAENLIKIPHFSKLRCFFFYGISESFDIDKFFEHLKKNRFGDFALEYYDEISNEYKEKLQTIVDQILDDEPRTFRPAYIRFNGQFRENELRNLCKKYFSC